MNLDLLLAVLIYSLQLIDSIMMFLQEFKINICSTI